MGTGINLYLASEFEYRRGLAHKLLDENVIDFCLADHLPWTEKPEEDERIVTVDHRPSGNDEYDIVCDLNELPMVSKELMEAMLPYESMAIHIGMRRFNYPTTEYDEEKRKYLQHLRYWNYMLDKYRINLIVTHCIPHSQGKFVVYGLAKVRKIPMLIWHQEGFFSERCIWGNSLENLGRNIGKRYVELSSKGVNNFSFDEDIERAYHACLAKPIKQDKKKYDSLIRKSNSANYDNGYKYKKKEYARQYFKSIAKSIIKTGGLSQHYSKGTWFRLYRRHLKAVKYFKRHLCCSIEQYDKIAKNADYSSRYILFLPQVYPEASVIPAAGVFGEQYNSIQLLARAAEKNGVLVYVKEHPHLPYRTKDFYDEIKNIKNVRLIKTSEFTYDLIQHSIAVSTQTGTCIIEAMGIGKPVLVFGQGYLWKDAPGLFEISDENQGSEIIKSIMNGITINPDDVKRYFYAIQLETLKEVDVEKNRERVKNDAYVIETFPLDDRVALIKRFISEEM